MLLPANRRPALVLICGLTPLFVAGSAVLAALPAPPTPPVLPSAQPHSESTGSKADPEWEAFQSSLPRLAGGVAGSGDENAQARPKTRREIADDFRAAAKKAKRFQQEHGKHPKSTTAKRIEATNLLNAAMAGDDSELARAYQLVEELRHDESVPAGERVQLIRHADMARERGLANDPVKLLAARLNSARGLIADFPQELGGYEALLNVAQNHPDPDQGAALARELTGSSAPAPVRAAAEMVANHLRPGDQK